jgi:hypothetical protein
MDVGDVGRQRDLVEKDPDHDGDIDGKHQAPFFFMKERTLPHTQIHSAPEIVAQSAGNYHMADAGCANILDVVPAKRALASASRDP